MMFAMLICLVDLYGNDNFFPALLDGNLVCCCAETTGNNERKTFAIHPSVDKDFFPSLTAFLFGFVSIM